MVLTTKNAARPLRAAAGRRGRGVTATFIASLSLLALLHSGCATTPTTGPAMRSEERVQVAVALVRDEVATRQTFKTPGELLSVIEADLGRRNLQAAVMGEDGYDEEIAALRTTSGRLAALARKAEGAPLVLLVETRATFYSQLSGRYRWTVDTRLTLAPTGDLSRASSVEVNDPAFLFFDHQRESEAIAQVAPRIGRQVGALADEALVTGWPGLPSGLAEHAATHSVGDGREEADESRQAHGDYWRPLPAPAGDAVYFAMVDRFARPDGEGRLDDPHAFFGGTIAGLKSRIAWLDDLGVGTLWISPVYLSRETIFHGWGPFHGYWVEDHMSPWPRLGTFEELRALSDELRERGMRLLLDVVVNHVGYDAPLVTERPDWFNDVGPIEDWSCPDQLVRGEVHGLPDLDQDNPEVYDYLLSHAQLWIDAVRPDGFRLDAVKHVPLSFWRRFNAEIKEYAGDDFYLLGEDLEGDPVKLSRTFREGGFDALFDFPVHFALVDVFCRDAPVGRLASILSMDHLYGKEAGHGLVTFLDNHDLPRVLSVCDGDDERVMQALTALAGLRGTPALTWGTEIGLAGAEEPENRAPMRFDDSHPLHDHVKSTLVLREEFPWLAHAETLLKRMDEDLLVLMRPDETAVVLVVNMGEEEATLPLFHGVSEGEGRALLGGRIEDGMMLVEPGSAGLFELDVSASGEKLERLRRVHGTTAEPGPERRLVVRAKGVPEEAGDLVLVGAGESLGHWDLSRAVRFEEGEATLALPSGLVAEYKLALVGESEERWEEGSNRYLLVTPGDEPLSIDLIWREG